MISGEACKHHINSTFIIGNTGNIGKLMKNLRQIKRQKEKLRQTKKTEMKMIGKSRKRCKDEAEMK